MRIFEGVEALDGLPVLHIRDLNALACSDLHLGYEGRMADRGAFLPKVNLRHIKDILRRANEKAHADVIIINGDVKNEFSTVHTDELNEFIELAGFLAKDLGISKIIVVKGNHDNFINRMTWREGIEVHEQEFLADGFLFFHGEKLPRSHAETMVMGHLHPAITVYDDVGAREKLRCFLSGSTAGGSRLVVLPAISYFAEGVSVNLEGVSGIAPIFKRHADIDKMKALCIGEGETLGFGSVGELKGIEN
ncbi:MAG: metallophosphoesterase [Candidatus Marsarchaeota archaeon]|nr:metallophosphoesterase [Candidatus Marsarchaeota archaeon]